MKVLIDASEIDWRLLCKQKQGLMRMADTRVVSEEDAMVVLEGMLNLLDYIQDEAAKVLGESAIFEDDDEEEDEEEDELSLPCMRVRDPEDAWVCINDHTGCIWNDGKNECSCPGDSTTPMEDVSSD